MRVNSKGNLLLTFIMVVALSVTIFAFLDFMVTRIRESGAKVAEIESFYVADAGLNKAIWYLGTLPPQGKGFAWRTSTPTWESFGGGRYNITVSDHATDEVLIISTGEVGGALKTVSQVVGLGGMPSAFDYAVYCCRGIDFSGSVKVSGDVYVSGNTTFGNNCSFTQGYVYHPSGTILSGGGTWIDGGQPSNVRTFPSFDHSYYENLIAAAHSVPASNKTYSNTTINLNGQTIYVNGDVTISGNTTFNGSGVIVATGKINESGNTYASNAIKFVSKGELTVLGNAHTPCADYYSATDISASGNTFVEVGSMITKGPVRLSGNLNLSGTIYSETGESSIFGDPVIRGAIVANSFSTFSGNANVYFDETKFPGSLPTGFAPSSVTVKKGTWKGS